MPTISLSSCIITALLVPVSLLQSQRLELYTDLHHTHYYDNEEGHYQSVIIPQLGYSIGLGIDSFKSNKLMLQLQFDHVGGHIEAGNGGLGSGYGVDMEFAKSTLTANVLPLRVRIGTTGDLSFGPWFSVLLNESFRGDYNTWSNLQPFDTVEVNTVYESLSRKTNWGLTSRIAFDVSMSPSVILVPHFVFMMGLGREFDKFPEREKILRFHFGIGVKKSIAPKKEPSTL